MKQFQRNGLRSVLIFDIMIYLWTELQTPVVNQIKKEEEENGCVQAVQSFITLSKAVFDLLDTPTAPGLPASVAQLDARPTGDQEVAGSTPAEVGNILSWRLIMKYFLRSFSPFR